MDLAPEFGSDRNAAINLYSCKNCGLGYLDPRLSDEQLRYFYDGSPTLLSWYEDVFPATVPTISFLMRLYAREFRSILHRGRVLDFGCGSGVFTKQLRRLGFDVTPFDVGEVPKTVAKKHFAVDIVTDLATIGFEFDGIALLDVIEHVSDPVGMLKMLRERLKSGGILHLTTPNFASLARRLEGVKWKSVDRRGHLLYFDTHSIRLALRESGYEILRVRSWGPLSFILPYGGGHALSVFARRP